MNHNRRELEWYFEGKFGSLKLVQSDTKVTIVVEVGKSRGMLAGLTSQWIVMRSTFAKLLKVSRDDLYIVIVSTENFPTQQSGRWGPNRYKVYAARITVGGDGCKMIKMNYATPKLIK
jgi:hypothetical protein